MWRLTLTVLLLFVNSVPPAAAAEARGVEVAIFEPVAADAPTGNSGVFIGINRFRDETLSPLDFAVHDAVELAYLFVNELKLIPAEYCFLLLSGEPVAPSVKDHLAELRRQGAKIRTATRTDVLTTFLEARARAAGSSEMLVVAASSHGFEEGGAQYIMPSDGDRRLLKESTVPLADLEQRMQESKAGHRLLLVDACQERVSAKSINPEGAGTPMSAASLDEFKKPTGQAKLTSCSPGERSFEYASLGVGHGVFSYSILQALRGEAPADAQRLVRFGSVKNFVVERVTKWSASHGRQQTPWLNAAGTTDQLPLAVRARDPVILSATVRNHALSPLFDAALRTRLADRISYADLTREADRKLVTRAWDFVRGTLSEDLFVPYAQEVLPPPLAVAPFDSAAARGHQEAWSQHLGQPITLTNGQGMKLTLIPAGQCVMGSTVSAEEIHKRFPGGEQKWYEYEHPHHTVRITRPYYLGTTEVTVADFDRFVKATEYKTTAEKEGKAWGYKDGKWVEVEGLNWQNPGFEQKPTHPVTCVSWEDATAYCEWLSREEGRPYRLPTEAEWEYACRAGTETLFFWGDDADAGAGYLNGADETGAPDGRAWSTKFNFKDGYAATSPVGLFKPNAFGLCDMLGNVWEWCSDWYYAYTSTAADDPVYTTAGSFRVDRGGSWHFIRGVLPVGVPVRVRAGEPQLLPRVPRGLFGGCIRPVEPVPARSSGVFRAGRNRIVRSAAEPSLFRAVAEDVAFT